MLNTSLYPDTGDLPLVRDERHRARRRGSDQIAGQAIFPRSLPASLKRIRDALQRDGALQFVSISQTLT
jgi:hypothetical protein